MIRFKILRADEAAVHLLGWAKAQSQRFIDGGIKNFTKTWPVGELLVRAHSVEFMGDVIVKVWLIAAVGARLYHWPSINAQRTTAVRGVRLDTREVDQIPGEHRVAGVGLPALAPGLSFDARGEEGKNFLEAPLATRSRVFALFERMVRQQSWFAIEVLNWLLTRTDQITRNGLVMPFKLVDCLVSRPDASGAFYVLLGAFPELGMEWDVRLEGGKQTVVEVDAGTPADARLVEQEFRGVRISWEVMKRAAVEVSPTVWRFNFDSDEPLNPEDANSPRVRGLVRDVGAEYHRPEAFGRSQPFGDETFSEENLRLLPTVSPFARVYRYTFTTSANNESSVSFVRHALNSAGEIIVSDAADGIVQGTSTWDLLSDHTGGGSPVITASTSPMACDLALFSGEEFIKVGEHTYSGADGFNAPFVISHSASIPIGPYGLSRQRAFDVLSYIRQLNMVLSGDPDSDWQVSISRTTDEATYAYETTGTMNSQLATMSSGGGWTGINPPLVASYRREFVVPPNLVVHDTNTEVAFGQGPFINRAGVTITYPYPQGSGLPSVAASYWIGGVYWYREGGMGVLVYQVPRGTSERQFRRVDVNKYKNVFRKEEGYRRIVNADGSFLDEPGYEDLAAILARVMARTTVIVNNFAPPALFPWLHYVDDDGINEQLIGVICDE